MSLNLNILVFFSLLLHIHYYRMGQDDFVE